MVYYTLKGRLLFQWKQKICGQITYLPRKGCLAFRLILVPIFSAATAVSKSKCLLNMFWRWARTEGVLSVAGHLHTSTSHPSPMHMQIRVGSWEQLYFNFIIMPWCCSRGWGRGRGRQVNTLPAVLQYCSVSPDWWLLQSAAECDTSPHPAAALQWASSKPHKLQQQPTVIIIMYF